MWALLGWLGTAMAAEPALVGLFDASDENQGRATLLRDSIERAIASHRPVVPLEDVDPFVTSDARTYLQDCPPGETLGCTWVVAARAEVRWGVTGVVGQDADGSWVELAIIDVEDARVALSYLVPWDGDDAAIADSLASVLDTVEREVAEQAIDLDAVAEAERQARDLALLEKVLADQALQGLEVEQGDLARQALEGPLEAPRVTRETLAAWAENDANPPWLALGLGPVEYMHFRNAGVPLDLWRRRRLGRARQIVVRLMGLFGHGLGPQTYDGRYVYNNQNLAVEELYAWQQARMGATSGGGLEVGVGVHRFVEVAVGIEGRTAQFAWLLHDERLGDPLWQEPSYQTLTARSGQLTARVVFSPLPTWAVRPRLDIGAGYWWGRRLDAFVEQQDYPVFDVPWVVTTLVAPGVEGRLSEVVELFARVPVVIPVGGKSLYEERQGTSTGLLLSSAEPESMMGLGVQLEVGLQLRLGPIGGVR